MVGVGEHCNGLSDSINATELFNSLITSKLHTVRYLRSYNKNFDYSDLDIRLNCL
jgi:hypothetical protein